ncbi:hypothetical protein GCM10011492_18740 [Flexivirga endophytica]|uniref:DUF2269 family protein n=1 Tax=Flexivirga endophytica TaxID=1849103 RepID=A0A916T232_9MICO|nr:hypothetical protein GCM10011492_18740 [Flexivirga endophytica]GHB62395.1 hypothetical protein GCM10008112_34430 [Flexivirga endophytica]
MESRTLCTVRIWIEVPLLVAGVAWAWWVRRRMQQSQLQWLIRGAGDSTAKARTLTVSSQLAAVVLAVILLAVALWAEQAHRLFWVRIPLALLVISVYVPFATQLAPVRVRLGKLRRSPQQRMVELGARPPIAEAIARSGRPFAFVGSLIFLAAITVIAWHHVR